jgi:hypothetical protein
LANPSEDGGFEELREFADNHNRALSASISPRSTTIKPSASASDAFSTALPASNSSYEGCPGTATRPMTAAY